MKIIDRELPILFLRFYDVNCSEPFCLHAINNVSSAYEERIRTEGISITLMVTIVNFRLQQRGGAQSNRYRTVWY